MKWKTMVTTRTKRAPSWLRSGRGGALLAAFHKKSTFILAGLVSRVKIVEAKSPFLAINGVRMYFNAQTKLQKDIFM